MTSKSTLMCFVLLSFAGIGLLAACGRDAPAAGSGPGAATITQEPADGSGQTGLRTPTPAFDEGAASGDSDPNRWAEAASFQGTFTFTLLLDLEQDSLSGGSQTVRSSRSATGSLTLKRLDEETFSGEGTMTWSVDDFIEVRSENGEVIRTAAAQGAGETTLDPDETLLWVDLESGTYGLAIYPQGLYDAMEVQGSESIVGLEPTDELGPLGYLGLMDSAGIAGWIEEMPFPASGLDLGGRIELPDGSEMTWMLQPGS